MDELQKLYDVLVRDGKYTKSFEEFQTKWSQDQTYKDKVYDVVSRDGLYTKDKDSFFQKYSVANVAPKPEQFVAKQAQPMVPQQDIDFKKKDTTVLPSAVGSLASQKPIEQKDEADYFQGAFGDFLRGFDKYSPIGIGDFIDDMARSVAQGYRQGTAATEADNLLLQGTKPTDEQLQKFIDANKNVKNLGTSKEAQDFNKIYDEEGGGVWGFVKGIANNPSYLGEVMASSLVGLATNTDALKAGITGVGTGAAAGATTGLAAGGVGAIPGAIAGATSAVPYAMGLAGSIMELGSYVAEGLQEELGDKEMTKENVKAILENPEKFNSLRNKAVARGAIIGAVDAYTNKLASKIGAKILGKSAAKSAVGQATKKAVTKSIATGAGIEAVGGSVGEAAARAAIGQKMDTGEILMEGVAELPGGIRSTIQARFAKPTYKVNGAKVTAEEVDNLIETMTPDELVKTKIDIENDYEGRKFKIQDKIVTNSIKEQVRQGNPELNEPSLNAITELEKELKKLEGNTTQTGKDKAAAIRGQIKNIQENQLQEEAVTETIKTEQDAIQEQATSESVLRTGQPEVGLQQVGEGNVQPEIVTTGTEETITPQGTQEITTQIQENGEPTKTTTGRPIAGNRLFNKPLTKAKEIANGYYQRVFNTERPKFAGTRKLDEARAKRIADAYIAMKDDPNNPEVKAAYDELAKETLEQYKDFADAGFTIEVDNEEPYANSQEMIDDLRNNNRIKIFSTEAGFGSNPITEEQRQRNPLLRDSGLKDAKGNPLLINDVFRAIHDFYGHAELGNSFGPKGEENAWNIHARMFSPLARRAMTTETRGQNSYVNFSGVNEKIDKMREEARQLREKGDEAGAKAIVDKIYQEGLFAEQKIGLLPEEFSQFDEEEVGDITMRPEGLEERDALSEEEQIASMEKMFAEQEAPQATAENKGVLVSNATALGQVKSKVKDAKKLSIIDSAQRALNTLKSVFPNFEIVIHDTNESYVAAMDENQANRDSAGSFTYSKNPDGSFKGTININLTKANQRTVAHEVAHAIMLKAFGENVETFKTFKNRMASILSESSNKQLMDFASQYAEVDSYEEYLAELTAALEQQEGKIDTTTLQKIAALINEFVSKITNGAIIPFEDIKDTKQTIEFFKNISESIRKGEAVRESDIAIKTKETKQTKSERKTKAQLIGKNAQLSATVKFNLNIAEEMDKNKMSAKDIRLATGWEKGLDGKWRYEIPDGKFKDLDINDLKREIQSNGTVIRSAKLSDVFDAPELYEAYPEAKDIKVSFADLAKNNLGSFSISENKIRVNKDLYNNNRPEADLTMLHEIQHYVQEKEFFESGANQANAPLMMKYIIKEFKSKVDSEKRVYDYVKSMYPDNKEAIKKARDFYKSVKDRYAKVKDLSFEKKKKDIKKQVKELGDSTGKNVSIEDIFGKKAASAFNLYYRVAGEVEARNVENRTNLSPEERRKTLLSETENIDREDQIMFDNSKLLFSEEVQNLKEEFPISKAQIDAYHGTPYNITQFSTEKVGTGEGAQEFGWGLYFTNIKEIAKYYADAISKDKKTEGKYVYDVSIHEGKNPSEYTFLNWDEKVNDDVKNKIRKQAKKEGVLEDFSNKLGMKAGILSNIKNYVQTKLYANKVVKLVNDGMSREEAIKKVASDSNTTEKNIQDAFDLYTFRNLNTKSLYAGLSNELGSDRKASEFLLRAGIDGIKYPTTTISNEKTKGSNYVVFDENAVKIKSVTKAQLNAASKINKVIKDARAQGFSESAIKTFLEGKGLTSQEIAQAMASETQAAGKVNITEEMLPGYERLMSKIDSLIKQGESLKSILSTLKNSAEYTNATDIQKEKLVRELRKKLGIREKSAPLAQRLLGLIQDVTKITMTEKQLFNKQIKDLARGAKDAKKLWRQVSGGLTKEIKELASSGKITAKQMATVLRKFSSVDMFNEKSIDKFVDYMVKVFGDAEYANKLEFARSMLKTAKNNINTKIGIADSLYADLNKLFSINPSLIPDSVLDSYLELVDMFGKRQAVLDLKEKSQVKNSTEKILDAIAEEQSVADELADLFNESPNKVFGDEGKLDFAESIKEMLKQGEITQEQADIMRKYKSDIMPQVEPKKMTEQEIAEEKEGLIKEIEDVDVDGSGLPTVDERSTANKLKELIKTEAINKLSNTELKNLLKVISNINNNYFPHYAQIMVEKMNAINRGKNLASAFGKGKLPKLSTLYAKFKNLFTGKGAVLEMIRRNPLYYIDQVFGDFKTKEIFNSLLKPSAEAEARFSSELKKIQNILEKAEEKVAQSFKLDPNKTLMSKFKMMTYMIQLEYESNVGDKQVNPASDYLKATIKHIDEGKSSFGEKDAEMLQDILDKYTDAEGNIDNSKLLNSFNQAEKSAISDIRKLNESLRGKAEYTAAIIRGDKISPLNNYVHLNVLHETKPNELTSGSAFITEYNDSMRPSTKAKSLIARTGKVSPLNFDVFASAQRGAKFVLMDYNLTEPIRTARKTLNEAISNMEEEGRVPKENRQIFNAVRDAFEESVDNLLTNAYISNAFLDDAINYISKQGYRSVLAGTSRLVAELTSNMGFAVISDPAAAKTGYDYKDVIMSVDAPTIMNNVGSTETNRIFPTDTLSGKLIDTNILKQASGIKGGKAKGYIANKIQQIFNRSGKKYINSVELTADALISTPDKVVMRPIWFGSFANEFKKITGQDINFDKIAANDEAYMSKYKDAINKAKTTADERSVFTGATDNAFMGILKGTPKPNQSGWLRAFNNFNNFMTRFLIFEYATARTGINAAIGNGTLTKKQGAALVAAVTTRMMVYTLVLQTLGTGLMGLFFDDEEEEDDDSILQNIGQAFASAFSSIMFGRDFGNATKLFINEGIERANEEYLGFLREGEYDRYKDNIQNSLVPPEKKGRQTGVWDYVQNMGGAFTPLLKTTDLIIKNASAKEPKTESAIERREKENTMRIPLEIAGNAGLIPFYKDIRKAVMNDIYKDLDKNKGKEKQLSPEKQMELDQKLEALDNLEQKARSQEEIDVIEKKVSDLTASDEEKQAMKEERAAKKAEKDDLLTDPDTGEKYDNETELKRYNPRLYQKNFGVRSEWYQENKAEKEVQKKLNKEIRKIEDMEQGYRGTTRKRNSDGTIKRT